MQFSCSGLSFTFQTGKKSVQALSDVSFTARDGEFLTIVGPSGCGKTTLLRLLASLLAPTSGTLDSGGSNGSGRPRVSLVFQERGLFPWMTVLDNATFGLEMQGVPKKERQEQAYALLERFGLKGRERAYPNELSAGMKQRVSVIRAFLSRPSALLMDEPFAALDYQTRLVLHRELLELWEGERPTVIFVTHDIDEAILLSDRILVLSAQPGRVVDDFAVSIARPRNALTTAEPQFCELKTRLLTKLGLSGIA